MQEEREQHLNELNDVQEKLSKLNKDNEELKKGIKKLRSDTKNLTEERDRLKILVIQVDEKQTDNKDDSPNQVILANDIDELLADNNLPYLYDEKLIPADKLSIPKVYDVKDSKLINSRVFFAQNESELIAWRRNLQEDYNIGRVRLICPECKQPVKISGHKLCRGKVCYFAHFKDSEKCPYKTGTNRTKEEIERQKYSLIQESERHKRLKNAISLALQGEKSKTKGIENVECEKHISSDIPYLNWRRPDVYAEYQGRKLVFEIQLSTTFVSIVVDRDIFYRLNNYNIIWVFNFEDNQEYVNLHNLMCKDIYYANKRNVFIFDKDAEEKSKEQGELILKCIWLDENGKWSQNEYVTLDMLKYDEENSKPYYVDADKPYFEKYPEYIEQRKQLEHSKEYLLKGFMEHQKREEELQLIKEEERYNLQKKLLLEDKTVKLFKKGNKYGYQFKEKTVIPAQYTSAEDIREDGYAEVGFNRKKGLVRKDGKEIVPVGYKDIEIINSKHGIIIAKYKNIVLWLGDKNICLSEEYDEKEQYIDKEEKSGIIYFTLKTHQISNNSVSYSIHNNVQDWRDVKELFTIYAEEDFCIIWVNNEMYRLEQNCLSLINDRYFDIRPFGIEKLLIAKDVNSMLYGIIDINGNIITNFIFSVLFPIEGDYLIAHFQHSKFGMIDYVGRVYIEPIYDNLLRIDSNCFAFKKNGLWGICDYLGNILHCEEYTYMKILKPGIIGVSTVEAFASKWYIAENHATYTTENLKLALMNNKGEILYTEETWFGYSIRKSGDLYSIILNGKILINYSLSYIKFESESLAIIKDSQGQCGFFKDGKFIFFNGCRGIEKLIEGLFKFENSSIYVAFGNTNGVLSKYEYSEIKVIDYDQIIAIKRNGGRYSEENYIIDKGGNLISKNVKSLF